MVYIVTTWGGYWGDDIIGVYSTKSNARKACERHYEQWSKENNDPTPLIWDKEIEGKPIEGYVGKPGGMGYMYSIEGYTLDQ